MALRHRTRQDALLTGCFLLLLGQVCLWGVSEGIPKECQLENHGGTCKDYISRYFFNVHQMKCQMFTYSGCGGNENRFFTKISCLEYCLPEENHRKMCLLPKDRGFCRANLRRWYYDPDSQTCKEFFFDGCRGNENNFPTEEECELTCHNIRSTSKRMGSFWKKRRSALRI